MGLRTWKVLTLKTGWYFLSCRLMCRGDDWVQLSRRPAKSLAASNRIRSFHNHGMEVSSSVVLCIGVS